MTNAAAAEKAVFPYLAEINTNKVNIRAGQSEGFEKLCILNKGDQVVVVDKSFSWCKIKIPPEAKSFISDKYVKLVDGKNGEVTADRVNIRAAASVDSTALGQLRLGDKISIVNKTAGWYQIAPPKDFYGWIAENLIVLKSRNIEGYTPYLESKTQSLPSADVAAASTPGRPSKLPFVGILKKKGDAAAVTTPYCLAIGGKPAYALMAPDKILKDFRDYQVSVDGTFADDQKDALVPVVNVSKIQIVY